MSSSLLPVPSLILSHCLTFFLLLQTATTTQWAMYLLSTHDDIQTKVKEEFENSNLRETCESDLMRGIVRETMRLYPVAPFIARFLPQDLKVFDSYIIPAGVSHFQLKFDLIHR